MHGQLTKFIVDCWPNKKIQVKITNLLVLPINKYIYIFGGYNCKLNSLIIVFFFFVFFFEQMLILKVE